MEKNRDNMMQTLKFEVLHMEKKNLRSKAKTDQRMSEELQNRYSPETKPMSRRKQQLFIFADCMDWDFPEVMTISSTQH